MTMTKRLALVAAVLVLGGCASPPSTDTTGDEPSILAEYGLTELDGPAIIDRLENAPVDTRPSDLRASIRPGELLLSKVGSDAVTTVDLPDGQFYLSVAPFVDQTHDCYYHSLTTCRGELRREEVHVTVTRRDTGGVLVDLVTQTHDNGFVGVWLPSDIEATISVEHDGYSASAPIATGANDPTCITTLQLTRPA
jgi:Periplasmic copper-binding protein CueP